LSIKKASYDMISSRIFKVLFFLGTLNVWTISASSAAADLTYDEAESFLESLDKIKIQNQEVFAHWNKSVRVNLNFKDEVLTKHITEQLARLDQEVQNLSVALVPDQQEANFVIELLEEKEFSQKSQLLKMALISSVDSCASRIGVIDKNILEVHVLIKNNHPRQPIIRCAMRSILQGLGIGDPQGNGVLLINSMRGLYDRLAINFTEMDFLIANFAYASNEAEKNQYISKFQRTSFDSYISQNQQAIKEALRYLSQPRLDLSEANKSIQNIININDRTLAYSYISYLTHLFSLKNLNLDISKIDDALLNDILKVCRNCYFSLLEARITSNLGDKKTATHDAELYVQEYEPQVDTILVRANAATYKGIYNIKSDTAKNDLLEAQSIYKTYYGERSLQFVSARHTLSMWYHLNEDYQNSAAGLIENQKLFDGTILDPASEAMKLIDSVGVFMKAGMVDEAQKSLDAARLRLTSAQRATELIQLEKVKQQYNLR